MVRITSRPLPPDSLLAAHMDRIAGGAGPANHYTDCFTADVPRSVTLPKLVGAFYNSPAFRPERLVLHLIGKGSDGDDVAALAAAETQHFAAWSVEARSDNAILLEDFQRRTCSWLMTEPLAANAPTIAGRTRLHFGSGIRHADGALVRALIPLHRLYAKTLLASAVKTIGRGGA